MPDQLTPEGYAQTAGTRCPACLGTALARGRVDSGAYAGNVTRRWSCSTCGATWSAVYELTGYEGLTQPTQDIT